MRLCAWVLLAAAGCGRVGFDALPADSAVPVAFDTWSSTTDTDASALAWSHAVAPGDTLLVVWIATRSAFDAPPTVASLTYGSQPLESLGALCPDCGPMGLDNYELWILHDPAPGTAPISAALTGVAQGASGLAGSYATDATTVDPIATGFGTSAQAMLAWTPPPRARFAVAGAMNQAGYALGLQAAADQVARADTVCDSTNWEGQTFADQLAVAGGDRVAFSWAFGSGSGPSCNPSPDSHPWIAIGATFR